MVLNRSIPNLGMENLSDEVILQILTRLPVKFLTRARTVCKRWYYLCLEDYFSELYNSVSADKAVVLLELTLTEQCPSGLICVDNARSVSELSLDFLKDRVKIRATCNGLLCCSSIPEKDVYYVCNPLTREFRLLPRWRERSPTRFCPQGEVALVGLACDVLSKKFVVVFAGFYRFFSRRAFGAFVCHVFDSSSNKWRKFTSYQDDDFSYMNKNQVVFLNGSLHWLTSTCSHILALDLEYDVWKKMSLPEGVSREYGIRLYLLDRNGFLSVIQISGSWMAIWVLEDYSRELWSLVDKVSLRCIEWTLPAIFPISQSSEDVILVTFDQVLVYHLPTRLWKRVHSVRDKSGMPLWCSAFAFKCRMTPCT